MQKTKTINIPIDEHGGLVLPEELRQQFDLTPGKRVNINLSENSIEIIQTAEKLVRVYIEPTNACNLECRTCMRNVWQEPLGMMDMVTFDRLMESVETLNPKPLVFFGGIGEPLAHPKIRDMVECAKKIGAPVELITNGILLDKNVANWMVELGLDRVWVSIDGAKPESYADVRLGDALPLVIANLKRLQTLQAITLSIGAPKPKLGIAFVAMKRNHNDLPEVVKLGKRLGADMFSVSNVLPYSLELRDQILYGHSMYHSDLQSSIASPGISLPRIDLDEFTIKNFSEGFTNSKIVQYAGQVVDKGVNTCPFVEKASISIRWDGKVSPCLPLLHSHTSYLDDNLRTSHSYSIGNILDKKLVEIWNEPEYIKLRHRLQEFDFSPCTVCNSCDMAESNLEDCFGNIHPTCGGCLWAQGFIQCP
ncbi:MAG: hypothetical protein BGO78_16670 [Chloroflexi bacterium 44-23]|nr:MAG: hypothetical protein BGO78_16670 [Chloroflexi bacterium 44-23]